MTVWWSRALNRGSILMHLRSLKAAIGSAGKVSESRTFSSLCNEHITGNVRFWGQSIETEDATGALWVATNFSAVRSLCGPQCNAAASHAAFRIKGMAHFFSSGENAVFRTRNTSIEKQIPTAAAELYRHVYSDWMNHAQDVIHTVGCKIGKRSTASQIWHMKWHLTTKITSPFHLIITSLN